MDCPDPPTEIIEWWAGRAPTSRAVTSSLLLLDPLPGLPNRRRFAALEQAATVRPRYRDYADAVEALQRR